MIGLALAAALSTISGIPKPLSAAWVDLRLTDKASWAAAARQAGVTSWSRSVGDGPFFLMRGGATRVGIVTGDGVGQLITAPADIQIGNQNGLLEYSIHSGRAICFAGRTGYGCAVGLSDEEMRERTKPHAPDVTAPTPP
jgi:hypothetical protein